MVHIGKARVGVAYGITEDEPEVIKLADLRVNEYVRAPRVWPLNHLLDSRPVSLRRRGLGRQLLERFLAEARRRGFREAWGEVTAEDLEASPFLTRFYESCGFTVGSPSSRCIMQVAYEIRQRL